MKGMITSIQRFSLNDGPGIRTTVFLKGCNLRCAWCHNPETFRQENELLRHQEKCIGCGHCAEVCSSPEKCVNCGRCAEICFPGAREMAGKSVSVPEAMAEILQDTAYYRDSGGGVTLSGGEAFCQPEFAGALIDACVEAEIPVAAESNLQWDFRSIRPMLEKLQLIMFDVKLFDPAAHRRWTGAGNKLILANVKHLDELGIPLVARTPLVPGVTDSEENIAMIANVLAGLKNLSYYELLNFNPLGGGKYRALKKENPFEAARPLPEEAVQRLCRIVARAKLEVKAG